MNANVSKLLNEQINKEFYSAYLYLDFANYYAAVGLDPQNVYCMRQECSSRRDLYSGATAKDIYAYRCVQKTTR